MQFIVIKLLRAARSNSSRRYDNPQVRTELDADFFVTLVKSGEGVVRSQGSEAGSWYSRSSLTALSVSRGPFELTSFAQRDSPYLFENATREFFF